MKPPNLTRLTDEEILSIFRTIVDWPGPQKETFVRAYANMVLKAGKDDFRVLRAVTLLFISKYKLVGYMPKPEKKSARK